MNDLIKRLEALTAQLSKHEGNFEGKAWNRCVTSFDKALSKFEGQAQETIKGFAPGMRDFLKFVENPASKAVFAKPNGAKLYKEIIGKRPSPEATPASLKKEIVAYVKETRKPKDALATASHLLSEITTSQSPVPKEKEKLLLELLRLGGVSDDQFEFELSRRFKNKSDLNSLAKAAGVPIKERKKEAIIADLHKVAKRQYGNRISL